MFDLSAVQAAIRDFGFDGWLLYDFRASNILARRVLGLDPNEIGSRRFFYFIPADGEPHKLVHRIESGALDALPGEQKTVYLRWQELEAGIASILSGCRTVAMEYSPRNGNPYVARVDAGTIEVVQSIVEQVVSSGDLIQLFEATLSDENWSLHLEASKHTNTAFDMVWSLIADRTANGGSISEAAVRDAIMDHFAHNNMTTYHPPIVGVGPHSGDPHYLTGTGENTDIRDGDFVLVDLWAKMDVPGGIYSDLTRVGFVGQEVPEKYTKIFNIVAAARDAGIDQVRNSFAANVALQGWQVDDATRGVIEDAGYGEFFFHRTGHSIGEETHGNGANIDNLETKEERLILPRTLFSIEPGIYQPEFGVRSEVDVFVDANGEVHVTGGEVQSAVRAIRK